MRSGLLGCASALALAALASGAQAQSYRVPGDQTADFGVIMGERTGLFARGRNVGVLQRPRPEWDARGLRWQSLMVRPTLTGSLTSDDNIYAKPIEQADAIVSLRPAVLVESDWPLHAVSAFARLDSRSYLDHPREDAVDWALGGNGRFDAARGASVQAGASYEQATEPRTAVSSPQSAAEPVRFKVAKAYLGGVKDFNRVRLTSAVDVRELDYASVDAIGGGQISGAERDRVSTTLSGRAEYAVSGATSVFFAASGNVRNYKNGAGLDSRDSKGVDVSFGASFDITSLMRGDVAVGYSRQTYDSSAFKDVNGASVRGKVEYFPTPLLTLSATAAQSIEETDFAGAAGFLLTSGQVRADYEFRRNILLSGRIGYQQNDFKGAIDRNDKRPSAGLSVNYLLNRSLGLEGGYEWLKQDSSGAEQGTDFSSNRFYLMTTYKF
jgi:hypothetical protein